MQYALPILHCLIHSLCPLSCTPLVPVFQNRSGVMSFKGLCPGICKFQFGDATCLLFFQVLKLYFDFLTTGVNICRNTAATSSPLVMRYLCFPQTHRSSLDAEAVPCHSFQNLLGDAIISIITAWAGRTGLRTQL
jgi:hypothetical protein